MRLHVLTAVTRPGNLPLLAESLADSTTPDVDLCWHWRFDLERRHIGGQHLKNLMLGVIRDGWVWVLDDDTLVHPLMLATIANVVEGSPHVRAIIVSQERSDGRVHSAREDNVRVGSIDIGQAVLRRDLIGTLRIPETYEGDGEFLISLLSTCANVVYVDQPLSLHNALSGHEIGVW
jgi:hypothetical protein